ncbi:MAG: hypothetical protein JW841_05955 [Deltaproteobacteria bacterium]|nr:hypothetical protein [Deltaproteobacteria bacterium]
MAGQIRSGGQPQPLPRVTPAETPKLQGPQNTAPPIQGPVDKQIPGQVPAQIVNRPLKTLSEKEEAKLKQQRNLNKISTEDAVRLVQQAGFVRTRRRKTKGFNIGDDSHAPIPIPDEGDDVEWSSEGLDEAQKHLALASAQLRETIRSPEENSFAETILGKSYLPTEENLKKLEYLEQRNGDPINLDEPSKNIKNLFEIELPEDLPVGHQLMINGLVVAGESVWVQVDKGKINERHMVRGVQKIAEKSNQSVGEAQKMSKGVNRELNLQRTVIFKR